MDSLLFPQFSLKYMILAYEIKQQLHSEQMTIV
jgi:hypothetical protein